MGFDFDVHCCINGCNVLVWYPCFTTWEHFSYLCYDGVKQSSRFVLVIIMICLAYVYRVEAVDQLLQDVVQTSS